MVACGGIDVSRKKSCLVIALLTLIGSLFSFAAFSPQVRAATLYVGGTGPGNYTTIQSAIDAGGWGATIYVYNGTYHENIVISLPLTLIGEGRDVTTIDGQGVGDVIYIWDNNVTITGFTVTNAGTGDGSSAISIKHNRDCYIAENTLSFGDQAGIAMHNSDANTIVNNNILLNRNYGIDISSSYDNVIANNTISHNVNPAINIWYSTSTTLTNNTMIEGGISLNGMDDPRDHWDSHTIDTLNTVNGKPVYYWKNLVGGTVPSDAGQVILVNTTDVVVKNTELNNVSMGILSAFSTNTTVLQNTVYSNNHYGIFLYKSTNGTVTGNTLRDTLAGVASEYSARNIIANNLAYSNRNNGIRLIFSDNSTVVNNRVLSNGASGIAFILSSRDNTVTNNTVYDNQNGIHIGQFGWPGSSFNTVFHNNILENSEQAFDDQNVSQWDDGYPSGGNYWSDYAGEDNYSGPNQNVPGGDGIGDTPYVIDADSGDRYPLMARIGDLLPPEIHDVLINGRQMQTYSPEDVPQLNLTAMIDDRFTGNSTIIEANYTFEPLNWSSSQPMVAADGVFNTSYEKALAVVPPPTELGSYSYCVYAWDAGVNFNVTSTACAELRISLPPEAPVMTDASLTGMNAEDVTVHWNRSPDDGSGEDDVVRYDVYRSLSLDGPYQLIGNTTANGSLTYAWTCVGCGEGDANRFFFYTAANDGNLSTPADNRVAKFTRPLAQGPNLVSVPLVQSDESIETVLQTVKYDKAWHYDSSSQEWKWYMPSKNYRRGLWDVDHTTGIWVNVTQNCNLTVAGIVPAQTMIHLHKGWNLVSFPSFNTSYSYSDMKMESGATRVEGYDPTPPNFLRVLGGLDVLQTGFGYWVRVETVTDWIVQVS